MFSSVLLPLCPPAPPPPTMALTIQRISSNSNSMSKPTTTSSGNKKMYLYHPQEWRVGILLLLILGLARIHLAIQNFDDVPLGGGGEGRGRAKIATIEEAISADHVRYLVTQYCQVDSDLLCNSHCQGDSDTDLFCGLPSETRTTCRDRIGSILTKLWMVGKFKDEQECSLPATLALGRKGALGYVRDLPSGDGDNSDVHVLKRMILHTYVVLYRISGRNFLQAKEEERMIQWILSLLVNLFKVPSYPSQIKQLQLSSLGENSHRRRGLATIGTVDNKDRSLQSLEEDFSSSLSSSTAQKSGLITSAWTEEEILAIMEWCVGYAAKDKSYDSVVGKQPFSETLTLISKIIQNLRTKSKSTTLPVGPVSTKKKKDKHPFQLFFFVDRCMYSHYDSGTLITDMCPKAMMEATHKIRELQFESGGDFEFLSHMLAYGGSGLLLLILFSLFSLRDRLESKLAKGKRRLEQELQDPFLRQVLEQKSKRGLPDGPSRDEFVTKLEHKAESWDSKKGALKVVRRTVRNYRRVLLFYLGATSVLFLGLWMFHVASLGRYLDNVLLNIFCFTATYWVPLELEEEEQEDGARTNTRNALSTSTSDPATIGEGSASTITETLLTGL